MVLLHAEAAPDRGGLSASEWYGVTLAVNVQTKAEVHGLYHLAVSAGGTTVTHATETDWGGYSCYIADPEGNRWEVARAPDVVFDND